MGMDDPTVDTPLYRDMYISTEILHCSHEEFVKLPKVEKIKLRMYLNLKINKEKYYHDKALQEMEEKRMMNQRPELRK